MIALGGTPTAADRAALVRWLATRFDPRTGQPPFSFFYDGQPSAALLRQWNSAEESKVLDVNREQQIYHYTDAATNLVIRAEVAVYRDFPAVEWVLSFRNAGKSETPILEDIKALDAEFGITAPKTPITSTNQFVLHHSKGSTATANDFEQFSSTLVAGRPLTLAPNGGRPSDGVLPFFNLEEPDGGGVVLGIGWTGQWSASFRLESGADARVTAGMERVHLRLRPGEEIRSPRILLVFWQGQRRHGQNLLRRIILAHYTPTKNGQRIVGPVWGAGAIGFNQMTEENQIRSVTTVIQHHVPIEYWEMDAGWFVNGWPIVGTWKPDPKRFPHGLKPISDVVHKLGLGYILWFEPERVMPNTWLRIHHPEWLLAPANLPGPLKYQQNWRLLNLGNPQALAWAKDTFSGLIRDFGVDVYRNDFNLSPLYYWRAGESADRQGMNEIRYVTGLYDYWDYLLKEHPGLFIDNSASGGRRFDLETVQRSYALFRTDYFWHPNADQSMTYGLAQWLPISAQGVHDTMSTYGFRSGMGTSVCLAYNVAWSETQNPRPWDWLQVMVEQYKAIREYFYGDFYPLVSVVVGGSLWVAYQFNREDLGAGMIVVFRKEGTDHAALQLKPTGLEPSRNYAVTFVDYGKVETLSGATLMQRGISAEFSKAPTSHLITYRLMQ